MKEYFFNADMDILIEIINHSFIFVFKPINHAKQPSTPKDHPMNNARATPRILRPSSGWYGAEAWCVGVRAFVTCNASLYLFICHI